MGDTERRSGQSQFIDPGRVLKAGEASYRPTLCGTAALPLCRWGDYEATSFDGSDRIWFAAGQAVEPFDGLAGRGSDFMTGASRERVAIEGRTCSIERQQGPQRPRAYRGEDPSRPGV